MRPPVRITVPVGASAGWLTDRVVRGTMNHTMDGWRNGIASASNAVQSQGCRGSNPLPSATIYGSHTQPPVEDIRVCLGRVRASLRPASVRLGWLPKRFTGPVLKTDGRKAREFESHTIRHMLAAGTKSGEMGIGPETWYRAIS